MKNVNTYRIFSIRKSDNKACEVLFSGTAKECKEFAFGKENSGFDVQRIFRISEKSGYIFKAK